MSKDKKWNVPRVEGNSFFILMNNNEEETPISLFSDLKSSVENLKVLKKESEEEKSKKTDKKKESEETDNKKDKKEFDFEKVVIAKAEYVRGKWIIRPVPWKEIATALL